HHAEAPVAPGAATRQAAGMVHRADSLTAMWPCGAGRGDRLAWAGLLGPAKPARSALARAIRRCEGPGRAGQPSVHGEHAAHLMGHLAVTSTAGGG
ncbi:MAG TPA: hypothetical protein VN327_05030, partial [Pseudonocardiaceae bacterium]|nr:hypothetical protein [Pseudonocardiaceae bacterium]